MIIDLLFFLLIIGLIWYAIIFVRDNIKFYFYKFFPFKLKNYKNITCYNLQNNGNWYGLIKNNCCCSNLNGMNATFRREFPYNCYSYFCKNCYNNYYKDKDSPNLEHIYKRIILKNGKIYYYIFPLKNHEKFFNLKYNSKNHTMNIYNKKNNFLYEIPLLSNNPKLTKPIWIENKNGYKKN